MIAAGEEVDISIDDPAGVDKWSVRTSSEQDVIVLRISGDPTAIGVLRVRVLQPGGVLVAQLTPLRISPFTIALSGRAATWTVELSLGGRQQPVPVQYRMTVARPSTPGSGVGPACGEALRARGISAWVMSVPGPPDAGGLVFPGLGAIKLSASPASSVSAAAPQSGAPLMLQVRGGTAVQAELAGLACDLTHLQLNLWDTGKGKPPTMSIADAGGRPLCGDTGHPQCPSNPIPGRWVTWTLSVPTAIRSLTLEGGDLYLSSIVIQ